jgi:putative transposase
MRKIINGMFYAMRADCTWRLLPSDFPPWARSIAGLRRSATMGALRPSITLSSWWIASGLNATLARRAGSSTTEAGGRRGYDAGKKLNGRKRHALVDTDGRGLVLEPHLASVQDRDGGGPLLRVSRGAFPFIKKVFVDSGYAGDRVANPDQVGFAVQPRRWVVERFFAWIGRARRLAKEATVDSAHAFLYAASVMLLVRRLALAS